MLALAKIMIDYLNEKELAKHIPSLPANSRGITKLERFLEAQKFENSDFVISFLRNLWDLRSTGVGHRKGENYEKVAAVFGIGQQDSRSVFESILKQAITVLDILETNVARMT